MSNGESMQSLTGDETPLTPVQIQQEYFENGPDCDWVKYEKQNRKHLKQVIGFVLFGSPSSEGDLAEETLAGYTSKQKLRVIEVYDKICEYSKWSLNNEDIYLTTLLIVSAMPKPLKFYQFAPSDHWLDLHTRNDIDIICTAVFKIRKCIPTTGGAKCCSIFIDDNARVYQTWDQYLSTNLLPKCVIVAPENGEYQGVIVKGDAGEELLVKLSVTPSPALGLTSRVLSSTDTLSTVATVGSLGVLGVAAFTPVAPIVLTGAAVATVATGLYGIFRSSLHLHDTRVHEKSINPFRSAEARGSWINVAVSGVGLSAGAASSLLARSAGAGADLTKTSSRLLLATVDTLRYANILTGGVGILNSLVHFYIKATKHGERPTKLELFQFSVAVLFFYQAAITNRTAENIVKDAQANSINEFRTTLKSNRQRKAFDKASAETRRMKGTVHGNTEVINCVKNIVNKDQYFSDLVRINKDLNQHKVRVSMTADGRVNLNAAHSFEPSQLSGLSKQARGELFSTLGPSNLKTPNVSTRVYPSETTARPFDREDENDNGNGFQVGIRPEEVIRIGAHLVRLSTSGAENVATLLEKLSEDVYKGVMTLAMNIISQLVPADIAQLKLLSPHQDLVEQVVTFVFNYLKQEIPMGDPCRENDNGIVIVLKEFFQNGCVKRDTIIFLKDRLMEWVFDELEKHKEKYPNKKPMTCKTCGGVNYCD